MRGIRGRLLRLGQGLCGFIAFERHSFSELYSIQKRRDRIVELLGVREVRIRVLQCILHLRDPLRLSGSRKPPLAVRAITVGKRSLFPASRAEAIQFGLIEFVLRLIEVALAHLNQSKPQMRVGRMRKQIPRFFEIGAGVL